MTTSIAEAAAAKATSRVISKSAAKPSLSDPSALRQGLVFRVYGSG